MAFNYKTEYDRYKRYYHAIGDVATKPKNREYTTIVLSFLATALFAWYAVLPTIRTILYLRREIADEMIVSKKMEEKIAALIEAQAAYQQLKPKFPLLAEAMPNNPDILILISNLKKIATEHDASLSAIQIPGIPLFTDIEPIPAAGTANKPSATKPFIEPRRLDVSFSVTLYGTYAALLSFFTDILSLRRIVTIDSMEISPLSNVAISGTGGSTPLQVVLKLNTYYLTTEPVRK